MDKIPDSITSLINQSAAFAMLFGAFLWAVRRWMTVEKENKALMLEKADTKVELIEIKEGIKDFKSILQNLQTLEAERESALQRVVADLDKRIINLLTEGKKTK